jgi:hypothetical protein
MGSFDPGPNILTTHSTTDIHNAKIKWLIFTMRRFLTAMSHIVENHVRFPAMMTDVILSFYFTMTELCQKIAWELK